MPNFNDCRNGCFGTICRNCFGPKHPAPVFIDETVLKHFAPQDIISIRCYSRNITRSVTYRLPVQPKYVLVSPVVSAAVLRPVPMLPVDSVVLE